MALQYDGQAAGAPRIVAKGKGRLAETILERARDHGVPVRRDDDLAAVLSHLALGQEIPEEQYRAVAEVLAFIYRMNRERV